MADVPHTTPLKSPSRKVRTISSFMLLSRRLPRNSLRNIFSHSFRAHQLPSRRRITVFSLRTVLRIPLLHSSLNTISIRSPMWKHFHTIRLMLLCKHSPRLSIAVLVLQFSLSLQHIRTLLHAVPWKKSRSALKKVITQRLLLRKAPSAAQQLQHLAHYLNLPKTK